MAVETVRADELRPGDILSTNGARIESVVLCQGGIVADRSYVPDEVCVCSSFEDGSQRFEYVDPAKPVYVWKGGSDAS